MSDEKEREKEREKEQEKERMWGGYQSLFWPVLLIGLGVLFLLDALEVLPADPWTIIGRFWPVILIVVGLDILFGRSGGVGSMLGAGLALVLVAGVIVLAFTGIGTPERKTQDVQIPLDGTERSRVEIELDDYTAKVESVRDDYLLEGTLSYYGTLQLDDDPEDVHLRITEVPGGVERSGEWDLRLSDRVRFQVLHFSLDDGSLEAELDDLDVEELTIKSDDGSVDVWLPARLDNARIEADDGSITVTLPDVPDVGVRVDLRKGDGAFNNRADLELSSGNEASGTWETAGYDDAERRIRLEIAIDDGAVTIQ